ncbi:MAG: metal-dependent hydrolase [Verrucomicrobiota bacterium]
MDSLTQATLGAAVGEAILGKKIGNRAILWGALFGTIPDLDVIFSPLLDNAQELAFHRGGSHSLLLMVIASLALAKPLAKLWKIEKVSPMRAGIFVFLAWSTHVLIDCFTVYGTSVLWPFSPVRVGFNNLFIIDPLYTLPLLVSLIWLAFYRSKKQQPKRTRILNWGLGISSAYVVFSFAMKFYASSSFDADLARRDIEYNRRMEAPTAFNTLLWRSILEREDEIWVGYRSVLEMPSKPIRWTVYPRQKEIVAPFANEREVRTIDWFSQGWWIARPHAQGIWMADMRFGETRIYDDKPGMVDSRFMFSWSFEPNKEGERLNNDRPSARNVKDSLKRIGHRILGNTKQWEANPRLAGLVGALPETLRVVE